MSHHLPSNRADRVRVQLDDFFNRSRPATSFRDIYTDITGDRRCSGLMKDADYTRLRECAGASFREAVSSGTFASILGDAVSRAMIREYATLSEHYGWRSFCETVDVRNFRTQRRARMGGYGNLAEVAENGPYQPLSTPTDEEATYKVSKRGGIETITLEAVANDDVGMLRRIPLALATAAHRTLYEYVMGFFTSTANIYDGKPLFHADHANSGTAVLSPESFAAARLAMRRQPEQDSNKPLGLRLRNLVVPDALEEAAYNLFQRTTENDPTFVQSVAPAIHVVSHWDNEERWFATADTLQTPLIELGFYGGEDPQVLIADDPQSGSMFSHDQLKMKVRHIYNGAVLDYRGFYGGLVP